METNEEYFFVGIVNPGRWPKRGKGRSVSHQLRVWALLKECFTKLSKLQGVYPTA